MRPVTIKLPVLGSRVGAMHLYFSTYSHCWVWNLTMEGSLIAADAMLDFCDPEVPPFEEAKVAVKQWLAGLTAAIDKLELP